MTALSAIETAAVERVAAAPMLRQVETWAAVNSGTGNLAGLATMAGLLADAFAVLPGDVRLIEPAAATRVSAEGHVEAVEHGRHLRLSVRPEATLQLLLTGHMDTVYPAGHPFQSVTRIEPNTLGGPGVADMKGGLALMLAALTAVEASPARDRVGYDVLIVSDEETGSFSSAALIAEAARNKHAALTYEPALEGGMLAGARGGTGNFSFLVRGRSAHAGRNPEEGRNAIVAAADIAIRLTKARGPRLAVNPARIEGGGPNNVVPDTAVLRVNFRPATGDDIVRAQATIDATVAMVAAEHDVSVEVHGGFNRPPKPVDAAAARLFETVFAAGRSLGLSLEAQPTGGVCDGNNIAACGVPVVDTMGVRGGGIHSANEYLSVDSLAERAAVSAVTMLRLMEAP